VGGGPGSAAHRRSIHYTGSRPIVIRYVLSRLGQAALVLWAAFTLSFVLLQLLPGDGILIKFESPEAGLTAEQIQAIRDYYQVDSPPLVQYLHTLVGFLQGDFGYSIENGTPVLERLAAGLPQTLILAFLAFLVAVILAVVIAFASSYSRLAWIRNVLLAVPSLMVSIPAFWLGIVLIQIFSFQLKWIPVIGGNEVTSLILPVLTLAVPVAAPIAQVLCKSLDQVSTQPFVHVVEAKGASRWWTLWRHVGHNALLPTLTIAGLIIGELIAGSVVTETVFGRNGIGRLVNSAVAAQDIPVMQAVVVVCAAVFVMINLIVDLLYPVLDPRLRTRPNASAPRPRRTIGVTV
jgi:peptide/nickel transport system permease protein